MPGLTYTNNVPQATSRIKDTQVPIQTNFASIQTWADIDHVDFALNDHGKHNKSTYVLQGATPAFAAGEYGIWNQSDGTFNQIWLNNPVTGDQVPFAASSLDANPALPTLSPGYTYLPSGIIIQWANGLTTGTNIAIPASFNFPITFPTQVFTVITTPATLGNIDPNGMVYPVNIIASGFTCMGVERYNSGVGKAVRFNYIAIGY